MISYLAHSNKDRLILYDESNSPPFILLYDAEKHGGYVSFRRKQLVVVPEPYSVAQFIRR